MPLDTPPAHTLQADLDATVRELEQGLWQLPLAKAVARLSDWQQYLRTTDRADLAPIADGLADLERYLAEPHLDGRVIGEALARLGTQTRDVADTAPETMRNALHRLGSILQRVGYALAGRFSR